MTTTVAPAVWLDLVAGKCWAIEGLDYLMEADGCERAVALAALHEAAADWLRKKDKQPNDDPSWYSFCIRRHIQRGELVCAADDLNLFDDNLRENWGGENECQESRDCASWCQYAYAALTILRQLQAIPGGEYL
jgi:hypothetical protein